MQNTNIFKISLPKNEKEFLFMMDTVDEFLRNQNVPPHARPIRGWFEISKTLKLELRMLPDKQREPTEGVFTGDDLTIRIFRWFDEFYGEKLKYYNGPGRIIVLIRGNAWEVKFPMIYGTVELFISPLDESSDILSDLKFRRIPRHNILQSITDFPKGLAKSLTPRELNNIFKSFILGYQAMSTIKNSEDIPLMKEVLNDIDTSVFHILSKTPHYGFSKWASLQASEKSIKAFLRNKNIHYNYTHKLNKVANLARDNGLKPINEIWISDIQCTASIRYGEENCSLEDAYKAHKASIKLCEFVTKGLALEKKSVDKWILRIIEDNNLSLKRYFAIRTKPTTKLENNF